MYQAIMYIWMIMGIVLFRQHHAPNDESICVNMFQCTLAYVFIALRGDGVKDLMQDLQIPLNLVDSLLPDQGSFSFFLSFLGGKIRIITKDPRVFFPP